MRTTREEPQARIDLVRRIPVVDAEDVCTAPLVIAILCEVLAGRAGWTSAAPARARGSRNQLAPVPPPGTSSSCAERSP